MVAIRQADLQALLARFPAEVRLLLFAGPDESASHAQAMAAIAALSDPGDPMAVTSLSADQLKTDPGRLADEAAALSMFGGRRVIRVDGAADGCMDAVQLLMAAPAAGNPVVMLAGDLPKSSGLRKLGEGSAMVRMLFSYPMDARAIRQWIAGEARALGLAPAAGVIEQLALASGHDVGILGQELRKFALYLDASPQAVRRLEPAHLAALGAGDGEEDLFGLLGAVIEGDRDATARQLGALPGGSGIPLLRNLARKLMQLLELRGAMDRGTSADAAARAMRPPLFWKEQALMAAAAGRWPQPRIGRALDQVLAAEAGIKAPGSAGDVLARQAVAMIAATARPPAGGRQPSA